MPSAKSVEYPSSSRIPAFPREREWGRKTASPPPRFFFLQFYSEGVFKVVHWGVLFDTFLCECAATGFRCYTANSFLYYFK